MLADDARAGLERHPHPVLGDVAEHARLVAVVEGGASTRLQPVVGGVEVADQGRRVATACRGHRLETARITLQHSPLHRLVKAAVALPAQVHVGCRHLVPRAITLTAHHHLRLRLPDALHDLPPERKRATAARLPHAAVAGGDVLAVSIDAQVARPTIGHCVHEVVGEAGRTEARHHRLHARRRALGAPATLRTPNAGHDHVLARARRDVGAVLVSPGEPSANVRRPVRPGLCPHLTLRRPVDHVRPPHQSHRRDVTQHLSPLRQAPVGRWVAAVDVIAQLQAIVPRAGARRRLLYLDEHDR